MEVTNVKKIISTLSIICFLSVFGCGDTKVLQVADNNTVPGYRNVEFNTYGLFNKNDEKNPNVKYRLVIGNVVWSVILCATIVAPVYFIGFSLYEPVAMKTGKELLGEV
jgi:hypothetical protein